MFKKIGSLLLATTMLTGLGGTLTATAAAKEESKHIPNVSALTLKTNNNVSKYFNADGEEVDLSTLNNSSFLRRRVMVPQKYDLRDEGRSTSVKNQGSEGFCWSFASNASMESNIITKNLNDATDDEIDLSESGGAWFSCNGTTDKSDPTYGDHRDDPNNGTKGGNAIDAAESLSSGYGTYPEELAMYDDRDGYSEGLRYYSDYRLKDFTFLPEDFNLIKQRIMEKGAMYYTYKSFMENYFETEDGTVTYSDNGLSVYGEDTDGGHAVTIVGWDDNFSKDNFRPDAGVTNDGAWLCKNSWGENWGNDGYFWVSYESFAYEFGQFEMQDKDTFDTIHQHQASSEQYLFGGNDVENPQYFSSANVFTAETAEQLKQICYTNAVTSNVKVKIYALNEGYTSPVDGSLLAEFDSDVKYAGTHCLEVPGNINLNKGDIFSVVIEGDALMTNFRYEDAEYPTNDKLGKSYFTENGTDWTDVADYADASYAAIKAYTTKMTVDKTELKNLIEAVKEYKPSNKAEQMAYDSNYASLIPLLEKAEKLMNDENVTNTDVKNFCGVLQAQFDTLKMKYFTVNNMEDFKTLLEGIHTGSFNNTYAELNTDIDLTGFNIYDLDLNRENMSLNQTIAALEGTTSNVYLDGKGHTIKNFDEVNLFRRLTNSTIKNLNIENFNVDNLNIATYHESGLLTGCAVNTKFININMKNSSIKAPFIAALLSGEAENCTFMDCNVENCSVIGEDEAGLFFTDLHNSSEVVNCKSKDYAIYSFRYTDDNMGFSCTYLDDEDYGSVTIKVTDNECVVKQLLAKLETVKVNGVEITPDGSECHIDKAMGPVILDMEYSMIEDYEFTITNLDIESYTANIYGYVGTDKDIVIPEEVYGIDIVGLWERFELYSIAPEEVNSIAFPDSIRAIGEKVFINYGAKSVTLGKNVQSIGDYAFGYCETESGMEPVEGFTIYGYSGTAAETYANANGFNFVDLNSSALTA